MMLYGSQAVPKTEGVDVRHVLNMYCRTHTGTDTDV